MKEQLGKYCFGYIQIGFWRNHFIDCDERKFVQIFWIVLVGGFVVAGLAVAGLLLIKNQ